MATLSTDQRKEMPKSEFGVPSQRRFPINDKNHARAALSMIGRAKNLTASEKVNIIRLAHAKLAGKK